MDLGSWALREVLLEELRRLEGWAAETVPK